MTEKQQIIAGIALFAAFVLCLCYAIPVALDKQYAFEQYRCHKYQDQGYPVRCDGV